MLPWQNAIFLPLPLPAMKRCHHRIAGNRCLGTSSWLCPSKQTVIDSKSSKVSPLVFDYNSFRFDSFGYATSTNWQAARWMARRGWHRKKEKSENGQNVGFCGVISSLYDRCSSWSCTSEFQIRFALRFLHPYTSESSSVCWHLTYFYPPLSSEICHILLFSAQSPYACARVAPWYQYGGLFPFLFQSYSPRPFAHAHARPRSSPDWMALCQPATAIVLICSSSLCCPSPCLYISIPLSSPYFVHSLSESFSLSFNVTLHLSVLQTLSDARKTFRLLKARVESPHLCFVTSLTPEGIPAVTALYVITAAVTYSTETGEGRRKPRVLRTLMLF